LLPTIHHLGTFPPCLFLGPLGLIASKKGDQTETQKSIWPFIHNERFSGSTKHHPDLLGGI